MIAQCAEANSSAVIIACEGSRIYSHRNSLTGSQITYYKFYNPEMCSALTILAVTHYLYTNYNTKGEQ